MEITGITTKGYSISDFVNDMRKRQEQYLPFVAFTNASMLEAINKTRKLDFDGVFSKRCYIQMFDTLKLLLSNPEYYGNEKKIVFHDREVQREKDPNYRLNYKMF
ncbi:hypothetical protein HYU21_02540 [Candidatus Woesearchaeota archaeon]|nr:hypothetical protein [Candidatus Woesearchaeota archaeon]